MEFSLFKLLQLHTCIALDLPDFLLSLTSRLGHLSFLANVCAGTEERHAVDHGLTFGLHRNLLPYLPYIIVVVVVVVITCNGLVLLLVAVAE